MSTCRGCWNDWRVPLEPGMVSMTFGYEDGGCDDPIVCHYPDVRCSVSGDREPHKMSECGAFISCSVRIDGDLRLW